jgi:hypothetical protein
MPHPIKVVNTALSVATKADEIAKETAKTGKVTAVVAVMSVFKRKNANCGALFSEMRGLLAKELKLKKREKVGYGRN